MKDYRKLDNLTYTTHSAKVEIIDKQNCKITAHEVNSKIKCKYNDKSAECMREFESI